MTTRCPESCIRCLLAPLDRAQILIEFCLTSNEFILGVDQVGHHWGVCRSEADL